jgi:hypothetical protein
MRQHDVDLRQLRRQVESEFLQYAVMYEPAPPGATLGTPWTKERVEDEVEAMATLVVDPYFVEYESGDDLQLPEHRLIGIRGAFVVAEDRSYLLLYDFEAENYVLACRQLDGRLTAWGIRGDAASTFLCR